MKVLASNIRPEKGLALTIGAFDGVHLGHRALIDEVVRYAKELDCASAVITFDRHPAEVVRPESAPKLLTDLDQKLELLAATGIDYTLVLPFDEARASERAQDFVNDVLVERLGAKAIVVGYDFHFGKGREGTCEMLRTAGAEHDFVVSQVGPKETGDTVVSSTAIRKALGAGEVETAAAMLGRPYEVRGLVVMGDGRGRELGYPTANIHVDRQIQIPGDGVYAGRYIFPDGREVVTAVSVGTRPTFYADGMNLIEAFLLDFDEDLYGQHARVQFTHRIRGQEKFESIDELIVQMEADVNKVRELSS